MNDDPPEKVDEYESERIALAAAVEAFAEVDFEDLDDLTRGCLRAFSAIETSRREQQENKGTYLNFDSRHIVASALICGNRETGECDAVDVHPYASVATRYVGLVRACLILDQMSNLVATLHDDAGNEQFGEHHADDALILIEKANAK